MKIPSFEEYLNESSPSTKNMKKVFKEKLEMITQVLEDTLRNSNSGKTIADVRLMIGQIVELFHHDIPKSKQKDFKSLLSGSIQLIDEPIDRTIEDFKWVKSVLNKTFNSAMKELKDTGSDYSIRGLVPAFKTIPKNPHFFFCS